MKAANLLLFQHLETYCSRRGETIPSAGASRYVRGDATDADHLMNLTIRTAMRFGQRRSLSVLNYGGSDFIALLGFEFEGELFQLSPVAADAGTVVCLLSEQLPQPIKTPAEIRNIVEAGSLHEPGYAGHECESVQNLFPPIQLLKSTEGLDEDSTWRLFLMLCVEECRRGGSWIEEGFAKELISLADLSITALPYDALCRSMFDADPRTLFMALYRCLEATYAYESCRRLTNTLGLGTTWYDLAAALEAEVGWHPHEAASLNVVLAYAADEDLLGLCQCLEAQVGNDLQVSAGRAIYRLRNHIVHYRPGQDDIDVEAIDWNLLCARLVGIVKSVFSRAYSSTI